MHTPPPNPTPRRGPRPLLLHLTLAMLKSSVSVAASMTLNPGSPNPAWPTKTAAAIRAALASAGAQDAFPQAVLDEALRQDAALIRGILAYRRHPFRRTLPDPPVLWQEGSSRLLDYGGTGPPVMVVPSLVNRAWVLDLMAGHSMLRWLAAHGVRPLLLDWGWPDALERRFTLTDYVAGRLHRAMARVAEPVVLLGYCMGGLLSLAATQADPRRVRALGLLATPWDFHAPDPARAQQAAACLPLLEPALALQGALPVDWLQSLFALLDPWGVADKYRAFSRLDPSTPRARLFVALEDWLNDGIPLAEPVARACLAEWYGANTPGRGTWSIAGLAVAPAAIRCPTFVAIPARDRIVPPESATPLAERISGATRHTPAAGHVGMVAGMAAERVLWRPLLDWINAVPREGPSRPARRRPSL
jgi:pimeloyl-ACP methyl ester carboxylesterase